MLATVVDSGVVVVSGSPFSLGPFSIRLNGVVLNLTGKTVAGTVRRERAGTTVLNAALEDIAFTITDATNGVVTAANSGATSAFLTPQSRYGYEGTDAYLLQLKVMPDDYLPQLIRFYARTKMD